MSSFKGSTFHPTGTSSMSRRSPRCIICFKREHLSVTQGLFYAPAMSDVCGFGQKGALFSQTGPLACLGEVLFGSKESTFQSNGTSFGHWRCPMCAISFKREHVSVKRDFFWTPAKSDMCNCVQKGPVENTGFADTRDISQKGHCSAKRGLFRNW